MAESPTKPGTNLILMINEALGPDIAMKLYIYYLSVCDRDRMIPGQLIPVNDLVPIVRNSNLSDEEKLKLTTLSRELSERKQYREQLEGEKRV